MAQTKIGYQSDWDDLGKVAHRFMVERDEARQRIAELEEIGREILHQRDRWMDTFDGRHEEAMLEAIHRDLREALEGKGDE